jgi:hypothetical protein
MVDIPTHVIPKLEAPLTKGGAPMPQAKTQKVGSVPPLVSNIPVTTAPSVQLPAKVGTSKPDENQSFVPLKHSLQ